MGGSQAKQDPKETLSLIANMAVGSESESESGSDVEVVYYANAYERFFRYTFPSECYVNEETWEPDEVNNYTEYHFAIFEILNYGMDPTERGIRKLNRVMKPHGWEAVLEVFNFETLGTTSYPVWKITYTGPRHAQ